MPVAAVAVAGEAEEAFDHADDEEDSYTEDVLVAGHVIESELGTGAFAEVYVGRNPDTWKPVAIKHILRIPKFCKSVTHEYDVSKRLRHPHILQALECVQDGDDVFILFEMAKHGDLFDRLANGDGEPSRSAVRLYLFQISSALAYMHKRGVVHGDVKLENILIFEEDLVRLCDFGLAGPVDEERTGRPYGTSSYMAHEICKLTSRESKYTMTPGLDVWSFGIVLFAVLFNDLPWEKAKEGDAEFKKVLDEGGVCAKAVSQLEFLSPEMKELLIGTLQLDPAKRITMDDIVEVLSESRPWFLADSAAAQPADETPEDTEAGQHARCSPRCSSTCTGPKLLKIPTARLTPPRD